MNPQRILANDRNLVRTATLIASSTKPVSNQVLPLKYARTGTAQALLAGTYTGDEQADYDIQIVDTTATVPLISTPTFSGAGSGTLEDISVTGTPQTFTLQCSDAGIEGASASFEFEGVTIEAATEGTGGNDLSITVDQSGLTFTDSDFSLLEAIESGSGSEDDPLIGEAYDWDTVALNVTTGTIPATAQRIAFKDDPSTVYLNFKQFVEGKWHYRLVPALQRDVPEGTVVQIVTGGRTVTVANGSTEIAEDIITVFDWLNWIRTTSTLLAVDGVIANDRTPTGQAAREFSLRTDAHAGATSGEGSRYATGFTSVTVDDSAGTQLVTAECIAASVIDHPHARLGAEIWELKSSLIGDLGFIVSGEPFSGSQFGLTVPKKLRPGHTASMGAATIEVVYATREEDAEDPPPICAEPVLLGPAAVDGVYTFTYRPRPSGDCDCSDMPIANLNTECLGNEDATEGDADVSYTTQTITRLKDLRLWAAGIFRQYSQNINSGGVYGFESYFLVDPQSDVPVLADRVSSANLSLRKLVDEFERTLARIDSEVGDFSSGTLGQAGAEIWDQAVVELKADVSAFTSSPAPMNVYNIVTDRYLERLKQALIYAGLSPLGGDSAGTVRGDGCWQDWGDASWWESSEGYAPAFTNHPYWSVRATCTEQPEYYSTHEFAFHIRVLEDCVANLVEGDQIIITINGAGQGGTYQVGDKLKLPIIAAAPIELSGGVDGAPTQTWTLTGTLAGPLPPYTFDPDTPTAYSYISTNLAIGFELEPGGIDFAQGDQFRFAVEGGHFRYRKDGGAWIEDSPLRSIPSSSALIDEGLSLSFTTGAATSFAAGDIYKFRALQPYALSNLQSPSQEAWQWDGSSATLDIDLGSVEDLTIIALLHTIPDTATVTLSGAVGSGTDWTEPLTWRTSCIWQAIDRSARYLRLTVTSATGGGIQWLWLGEPLITERTAEFQKSRVFQVNRASGNLQAGRYVGKALSASMSWSEGSLTDEDSDALADMLDHIKENNDQPIIVIPQVTRTDKPVIFARVESDTIEFEAIDNYQANTGIDQQFAVSLPLAGVLQ